MLALLFAAPAAAQSALDLAPGLYGSATDPAQSCDANPHELSFIASPPHAILRWTEPRPDRDGHMIREEVYDLRDASDATLTLQLEGDAALPETGRRPTWILRLTQNPVGYCWGRSDWPLLHCEDQQLRCDAIAPTS